MRNNFLKQKFRRAYRLLKKAWDENFFLFQVFCVFSIVRLIFTGEAITGNPEMFLRVVIGFVLLIASSGLSYVEEIKEETIWKCLRGARIGIIVLICIATAKD